jgi:SAM-dependent methyltransferase
MTGEMNAETETRGTYWDAYYSAERLTLPVPSQFAAFVANEFPEPRRFVEFGCGTGRDALFFAQHGHEVVAVDGSQEGVEHCRAAAVRYGIAATFVGSLIDAPDLADRIGPSDGPTTLYARFFLHAITEDEQEAFLDLCASLAAQGDTVAVEYRTPQDAVRAKVTSPHYRRFIEPASLHASAEKRGFSVGYEITGQGLAKYREDDAFVARTLYVMA